MKTLNPQDDDFESLILRAMSGDRAAIETLAKNYHDLLVHWIRKHLGLPAGGDRPSDVIQQFLLRLLLKGANAGTSRTAALVDKEGKKIRNAVGYFQTAVVNQAREMAKAMLTQKRGRGKKATVTSSFFGQLLGGEATPSRYAIAREFRGRFQAALRAMPLEDRRFFRKCLKRKSWETIAAGEGKKADTVRKRFERMAVELLLTANVLQ